ncbi:uncharacterized protein BO66DRAFT_221674 [Aspergillus aculeatinus CBS 121060]|uniref:Uncharacterized protein n=1 Tax=Aspergillus aculeatinus CBS 121060 TaxID=1448322 RepID=A0ACD1HIB9_9EURO|nr:hypothetical protein BO66DRAFT_221674 [Aspergillus aculeatinus CBS 121060]RAH73402.1 hypothetical protein BO66DRAFT_221674 [Aspergillus aculeatinus CBS 121060]
MGKCPARFSHARIWAYCGLGGSLGGTAIDVSLRRRRGRRSSLCTFHGSSLGRTSAISRYRVTTPGMLFWLPDGHTVDYAPVRNLTTVLYENVLLSMSEQCSLRTPPSKHNPPPMMTMNSFGGHCNPTTTTTTTTPCVLKRGSRQRGPADQESPDLRAGAMLQRR